MRKLVVTLTLGLALVLACASQVLAWTWPADGNVVRVFAFGDDPYAAGQHRGVDIALPTGADVRAPTAGVVTFAGFVPSGGTTLSLATDAGLVVTLQQLGSLAVGKGATVSEGEIVGSDGSSSDATTVESHVHLGIRVASDRHGYIDPLSVLPGRGASTGAPPPEADELAALVEPSESLPESSDEQAGAAFADPGEAT
jgi:murein DD-endopeptidase MepM/ murein hydrolase activator NlpD